MKLAGQIRPAYFLYQTLWSSLDLLFPPNCGGCNRPGVRWCESCQQQVSKVCDPICPVCGEPQHTTQVCHKCQLNPPAYLQLRSYGLFQGSLREAMHRLKYKNDVGLGDALSKHLIELYNDLKWNIDIVTSVPLSRKHQKERGYNQASLLSLPLAYAIKKPFQAAALIRTRDTRSQVGLTAIERQMNVQNAFLSSDKKVKGKAVLIVDDVVTTGSTISACAQALQQAGASAVYGLTLARAVIQSDDQPTTTHSNGGRNGSRGRDIS